MFNIRQILFCYITCSILLSQYMNLYLFPALASLDDGYGIAVESDFRRCDPSDEDIVVWRNRYNNVKALYIKDKHYIIDQNPFISWRSIVNILKRTNRSEIKCADLEFLKGKVFDKIFCGDVCYYNAIRKMFPNKEITVRFHNCFARIYERKRITNRHLDIMYSITLRNMYRLERKVMLDDNTKKIFISEEDRAFYTSHFGKYLDSETWQIMPSKEKMESNQKKVLNIRPLLVWFGGVDSHKKASIDWFINSVYSDVKKKVPEVEFHLYGANTDKYNYPENKIFGHGLYKGDDNVPVKDALYINPDIIGGGVKMKLITYFEYGMPFISSIFGFEGFSQTLVDNKFCFVVEDDDWVDTIISLLKNNQTIV